MGLRIAPRGWTDKWNAPKIPKSNHKPSLAWIKMQTSWKQNWSSWHRNSKTKPTLSRRIEPRQAQPKVPLGDQRESSYKAIKPNRFSKQREAQDLNLTWFLHSR
jgi:hypothetical protein